MALLIVGVAVSAVITIGVVVVSRLTKTIPGTATTTVIVVTLLLRLILLVIVSILRTVAHVVDKATPATTVRQRANGRMPKRFLVCQTLLLPVGSRRLAETINNMSIKSNIGEVKTSPFSLLQRFTRNVVKER